MCGPVNASVYNLVVNVFIIIHGNVYFHLFVQALLKTTAATKGKRGKANSLEWQSCRVRVRETVK